MAKLLISANAAWNLANFRGGLIRGLLTAGHEVVCAAPPDGNEARLEALGCRFVPLPMDNKGTAPHRDAGLFRRYHTLVKAERPDVFLGYTIKPNVYGTLAARTLGVPAINNVSGLGTAFIRDTWLTRVVKSLYRLALSRSSTVFFQNADDAALFTALRLVRPESVAVLPGSGVDLTHYSPAPLADRGAGVRFLLIARLLRDKGVVEYVEAARLLRAEFPGAAFQLLGFLDVENRTAIGRSEVEGWVAERLIDHLGVTDDVRSFIRDADCLVLPSYREGTPRTLLEGAAMGRPLIATDVPGCREPVRDGVNGYLCEVRSAASLADAMRRFLALGQEPREAMGRESRRLVEERYDERLVVEAYLEAIARALGPRSKGATPPA